MISLSISIQSLLTFFTQKHPHPNLVRSESFRYFFEEFFKSAFDDSFTDFLSNSLKNSTWFSLRLTPDITFELPHRSLSDCFFFFVKKTSNPPEIFPVILPSTYQGLNSRFPFSLNGLKHIWLLFADDFFFSMFRMV